MCWRVGIADLEGEEALKGEKQRSIESRSTGEVAGRRVEKEREGELGWTEVKPRKQMSLKVS